MIDEWKKGAKYWDHAWNPVVGCEKISEGCANCYAASMAERFPELQDVDGGFAPHLPKCHKSPQKSGVVFVGNMTDLFGEWNSLDYVFNWMAQFSSDTNLVLTKRVERLYQYLCRRPARYDTWYGMTAENQAQYNERIKTFRGLTSLHTWLSAEPLLESLDLGINYCAPEDLPFDWVVVGAESGSHRRPCKLEWVAYIVAQCRARNIKVFVKQLDIDGKLVKDITKFPPELQIRQVPWKGK